MEIYIEYAFLENFFFDGVLLSLSLFAAREKLCFWRIALSATLGGVFAILFPLLKLPVFAGTLLKTAVGMLLCMPLVKRLKTKKEWGRYALICVLFFSLSFLFGGSLLGIYTGFSVSGTGYTAAHAPFWAVLLGFAGLSFLTLFLVRKLYAKKAIAGRIYACRVENAGKRIQAEGFLDSGNLAQKNGLPVCFLSPDIFYELFGEEVLKGGGQVCDELAISTLGGVKTVCLYEGEICIENTQKRVYFAPSANMISREYQILLHPTLLEE